MKIGFNCSAWDLFHAGHVTMLKEEKEHCDYLKIGLQVDPTIDRPNKNKPIQSIYERYVQLQACKYVDEILVYNTEDDLLNLLMTQKIDIRFLGDEYRTKPFTGKTYCEESGIELFFHERKHKYSSTELRNRITQQNISSIYGDFVPNSGGLSLSPVGTLSISPYDTYHQMSFDFVSEK